MSENCLIFSLTSPWWLPEVLHYILKKLCQGFMIVCSAINLLLFFSFFGTLFIHKKWKKNACRRDSWVGSARMVFLIYHYCLNNLEMLDLTVCSFLFCRFNVPEDWPYQEVRTLFKEPNVCTEIPDFMWTSPDSQVFIDRPHYTAPIVSQAKSAFLSVFRALWISCQLKTVSVLIG